MLYTLSPPLTITAPLSEHRLGVHAVRELPVGKLTLCRYHLLSEALQCQAGCPEMSSASKTGLSEVLHICFFADVRSV